MNESNLFYKIFINHPTNVKMSYLEHFSFSFSLGIQFLLAACKSFVHSFFPILFETSATDYSLMIYKIIEERKQKL